MNYKLARLSLLLLCAILHGSGETFRNPVRIPTGNDPSGVFVADLNGDGRPDILWTGGSPGSPSLSAHAELAQDDGSFADGPVLTLPQYVTSFCQVTDETGDGKPDLICPYANQFTGSIMVFPGNGDGSFGAPIVTPLPSSSEYDVYWGPVLGRPANLHGQGDTDFVIDDAETYAGYVLLGNGDGTFNLVTQNGSVTLNQNDTAYQPLDLNGDGYIDLAFSNGAVLLGDGKGQFSAVPGSVTLPGSCTFGEIYGEPHIDMVCGEGIAVDGDITGGTQLLIFHGNGDGTFRKTPSRTVTYGDHTNEYNGYGTLEASVAIVDLNHDGVPDVVAEAGDGLTVMLGHPGFNFSYPKHYATGYNTLWAGATGQFTMRISDLNGDGLPDLVGIGPNGVYITYGRSDGVFDTAQALELTQVIGHETIADFNEDGIPDIAATGDQAIELSLGEGDGLFKYRQSLPRGDTDFSTPLSATNAQIVHGDFNGDHHQDILAVGSSSIYVYDDYVLFGHGNGTFSSPVLVSNSSQALHMYYAPQVFDFNGDGKDDLFTSDSGNLYVSLSNGDGSFKTVTTVLAAATTLQTEAAIADINGDGKLDAVLGSAASVEIFDGNGDGSFDASGLTLPIPLDNNAAVQGSIAVALGDFDGDGYKDIALLATPSSNAQGYASTLFVYYGKGKGAFSAAVPVASFTRGYTKVYAADLNQDGLQDLVLKTGGSLGGGYAIGIIHSIAGRKFVPEVNYYAGTGLADLAIVDLNGDGFPDLVFGNGDGNIQANSATVLMNLGNAPSVTGSVYALPEPSDTSSSFQVVASLDAPDETTLTGSVSFLIDGQSAGSAVLAGNQASLTVEKPYSAGVHTLTATWPGDEKFAAVRLVSKHQITAGYPTSTDIVTSYNPAIFLAPVIFSATVQSSSGTPIGSVALLDRGSRLATAPLSGGSATFKLSNLAAGSHTITAEYLPGAGWGASSGSLQQVVNATAATTTLTFAPHKIYALEPFVLSVTVKAPQTSGPTPTGAIAFSHNFSLIGSKALADGMATLTTTFADSGSQVVSAVYSGDEDYTSGSSDLLGVNVLINPTVTQLAAAPNPAIAAQPVTLTAQVSSSTVTKPPPSGMVQFLDRGSQIGTAQLANGAASLRISSLTVGTHAIVSSYLGSNAFNGSNSNPVSVVIQKAPSSTMLSASPNPAVVKTSVILKAVVKGPRPATGTVVFYDGSKAITGALPVDSAGTATFSTTTLAVGTHTIVATYPGDPSLDASTSSPLGVKINP